MTITEMLKEIKSGINTTARLTTGLDGYTRQRAMTQINELRSIGYISTTMATARDGTEAVVYVLTDKGELWLTDNP